MVIVAKRKSKIVRSKAGAKPNMYFNEGTTHAIEKYQSIDDDAQRKKLYISEIYPAFDKLVENLIFIHGFKGLHDTYDDLKNDCIAFLYEAIHKFDPARGSKPFSYFNVVAKNWLIVRSKQRVNKLKKSISVDDDYLSPQDRAAIEMSQMLPSQDEQLEATEFVERVMSLFYKLKERALNENELKCIDAIMKIFRDVSDAEGRPGDDLFLNKRAVFVYIREYSGLSAKQLTSVISNLKKAYKELRSHEFDGIY